ncbi:glutamate racemase [Psychrobacter ciconiae]|uniref:glutamate racemase n=1 Tax=Psychrobacter ciconiae TaxID=1553449 RepID=UPI001918E7F8|nr:glutamate racemase [Psychrobacter ciconiae]
MTAIGAASLLTASASQSLAPIGLFDSGVGGLSVYQHLAKALPNERFVYFADTLNVPYGSRDSTEIQALTLSAVDWLCQQGCKLIVIACNSASAYGLTAARLTYPNLPIVGLVPALKPAVLASQSRQVAVLATKATLSGALLNQVITEVAIPNQTQVIKYFDPELVPWVEAGMPMTSSTAKRLGRQLLDFSDHQVDHIVLGCTHYPFFKAFLNAEIAKNQLAMTVIDSGQAIAERVHYLLLQSNMIAPPHQKRLQNQAPLPLAFYASKMDSHTKSLVQRLLGSKFCITFL